jgi:large subunit ribosomal protein L43
MVHGSSSDVGSSCDDTDQSKTTLVPFQSIAKCSFQETRGKERISDVPPIMATRGVFQCQKLTMFYCEHGGSSQTVRDFLASGKLIRWAKERPHLTIQVRVRNGKHPFVKADYLTSKPHAHQVCLKSNQALSPDIRKVLDQLNNRSGRKITKFTKPVQTQTPSVQGVWTPALNLHLTPEFPMQMKE